MGNVVKKRNWAFVLYPESAPSDWRDQLIQSGLPIAISPLHNSDINADGTPKKDHYHIILCYSGPTAFSVTSRFTSSLNQPIPQALESVKGYYRYLTHDDNPEKAQYDKSDIVCINGFDYRDFVELTKSEVNKLKSAIIGIINDMELDEYSSLIDYLRLNDYRDELDVAMSHTIFFNTYVTSLRERKKRSSKP